MNSSNQAKLIVYDKPSGSKHRKNGKSLINSSTFAGGGGTAILDLTGAAAYVELVSQANSGSLAHHQLLLQTGSALTSHPPVMINKFGDLLHLLHLRPYGLGDFPNEG
uniref:Uncharacterized protein n=1 Tax=Octactis speculum TaxID=3111310 RepID=A0A7S2BTQ9_9STRA|mmetsp:Transcript_27231/g.37398  ORF Transcript_27231/g.37398 Transcript_27231/m.37398 type:complete len:108 (+) Transcript_27231:142-465(+)